MTKTLFDGIRPDASEADPDSPEGEKAEVTSWQVRTIWFHHLQSCRSVAAQTTKVLNYAPDLCRHI